jgi:hypothetical protein
MPITYENVFGTSVTKGISGAKRPVIVGCYLFDEAYATKLEDTTVFTGTKITVVITLHEKVDGATCKNPDVYPESTEKQPVDVYHRLEGGAWEKLWTVTTSVTSDHGHPAGCGADKYYTLMGVGKHEFYASYAGNAYLEGCKSKVAKSLAR